MKEKRPLVWLSAEHYAFLTHAAELPEWQLTPITIDAELLPGAIPDTHGRVGIFDISNLSSGQLAVASSWLETLRVEHWVAVLRPGQIDSPEVCGLINRYCEDYHTLPIQSDRLQGILGHLWGMSELHARTAGYTPFNYHDVALEGESSAIRKTRELLCRFSHTEEPVLIYGENGTGKEAAARYIHINSVRKHKPLVVINCAALPPSLTQNELFGHEKGSFTNAMSVQKGRIESADGGTLLFVGVDELTGEQQSAILRFLQEGQIERIGGRRPIKVNARLIATSSTPLEQLVTSGRFRSDVFYRLGSLHVLLPPLRDRREDIPLLANRLLSSAPFSAGPRCLADATIICLAEHRWPGNLRELQNRIRQAVLLGEDAVIKPSDMGFGRPPSDDQSQNEELSLHAFRSQADRRAISVSLALAQNNVSAAARLLNISRVSFYRLMDKHQVLPRASASPYKRE